MAGNACERLNEMKILNDDMSKLGFKKHEDKSKKTKSRFFIVVVDMHVVRINVQLYFKGIRLDGNEITGNACKNQMKWKV